MGDIHTAARLLAVGNQVNQQTRARVPFLIRKLVPSLISCFRLRLRSHLQRLGIGLGKRPTQDPEAIEDRKPGIVRAWVALL